MMIRIRGGLNMIKVKTFTNELKALHAMQEIHDLDNQVNQFIQENNIKNVMSVSDACTEGKGSTIGIIRVLTYETA
jgi:peroxiredoxin